MKNHYFFSQPHQPFFVLAFVSAILSMILFMLMFKGIVSASVSTTTYHAYSMIFLIFTPAFLAFLFTTFPRFSGTPPIPKNHYLNVFWLFLAGSVLFEIGVFVSNIFAIVGMVIVFIAHIGAGNILLSVYNASPQEEKHDQYWILVATAFGLLSHLLFLLSTWIPMVQTLSTQMGVYLYLFLLAFAVAQRMIPFFSHCMIEKNRTLLQYITILLFGHILLETFIPHSSFLVDMALVYLIGKEILRWKLPFPNPNPLVWILHVAMFWIPVAFLFSAISNLTSLLDGTYFLFLDIHALMLGFLFTVMIGFGTRVTIGHSGNTMQADRLTTIFFYWTQLVVLVRLITSIVAGKGGNFMIWFDIAITVWLIMFIAWGIRFFGVLIFGKRLKSRLFWEK